MRTENRKIGQSTETWIKPKSRFLPFLMLSYAMVYVLANWFDPRLISVFGLDTGAGALIFPATYILSDIITEVYGYKNARRAIWYGFLFNIIFLLYGLAVIHFPSPSYYINNNTAFDKLLAIDERIVIASALSYLASEPLNAYILAKLKTLTHGHYIGLRFLASTVIASGTDTFLFGFVAFYGVIAQNKLLHFILASWFIKVCIEIVCLIFSPRLSRKLKKLEKLDIFDDETKYNIFSLEIVYPEKANQFKEFINKT